MAAGGAPAALVAALLIGSPGGPGDGVAPDRPSAHKPADTRPADGRPPARPRAAPTHPPTDGPGIGWIRIPAIGVSAPVVSLGLNPDRSLQVPARADQAGWWSGGQSLRSTGPTVIAGHVDSRTGPGVFFSLRSLRRGDRVEVALHGRRRTFRVESTSRHAKSAFPRQRVYGPTSRPALRLITCDGAFDGRSYPRNLIVFGR